MKKTPVQNNQPPAYAIVSDPLPCDAYSLRKSYRGYYLVALEKLAAAKRGSVLRFDSKDARPRLASMAKKLGYTLHYAFSDGKLFVQIVDTGSDK